MVLRKLARYYIIIEEICYIRTYIQIISKESSQKLISHFGIAGDI